MKYCQDCSAPILAAWRGWPLKDPVPLLPRVVEGVCECCGRAGAALVDNTDIQWLNYHGPYNTGLPDYWLLVSNQKTDWGLPYHSEVNCRRCGQRAVLCKLGKSSSVSPEYKVSCPSCGLIRQRPVDAGRSPR